MVRGRAPRTNHRTAGAEAAGDKWCEAGLCEPITEQRVQSLGRTGGRRKGPADQSQNSGCRGSGGQVVQGKAPLTNHRTLGAEVEEDRWYEEGAR